MRLATSAAMAALAGAMALAAPPARADLPSDAYPSPQAKFAHAEFLLNTPAPPTGAGTVCIIDTGVTPLPDMGNQIVERIALDGGNPDDIYHVDGRPLSGHGSFVAGAIASQVDGIGSAGIWPAAKIISVRVFHQANQAATPGGYRVAIAECERPIRHVKVITISLQAAETSVEDLDALADRIVTAHDSYNIDVVAAAGNNATRLGYPARVGATIAVGATDVSGAFCAWSGRGAELDVSALGCSILATGFDGRLGAFDGTSYSTPVVAGVLLALRSYRPDLSADQVEQLVLMASRTTAAGQVLDAGEAFRSAGLGALVDAYSPPTSEAPVDVAPLPSTTSALPQIPTLRSATFRHHVARLDVTKPPRQSTVVFMIGKHSYNRTNGRLNIHLRAWHAVTVFVQDPWGVRSPPLKIRHPRQKR